MVRTWPMMALYRRPWPISSAIAPQLDPSIPVEEEKIPNYHADRFYPIHLGQVLNGGYQVATKLGYGANSTVWLARDLDRWRWSKEKYVAIKVNAISQPSRRVPAENELDIMRHISRVNPQHKGWHFIRKLCDSFALQGTSGTHSCLVLEALREPLWLYRRRYVGGVIPPDILKILVQMILHALDYLHSECRVIHTDPSIFERGAQDEFDNPLPQKHLDARTIYLSRNNYGPLSVPTGIVQIVDFDLSVRTEPGQIHTGAIQGEIYRAPEVILNAGYTSSADIWSLGVMLWDLLEGKGLFNPTAPGNADEYDDQSHLGQIAALIGPPPQKLLSSGQRTSMFYKPNGELKDPSRVPGDFSFENTISCMNGEERLRFIQFIKRMVKWSPEGRNTAGELLDDPWLYEDFPQD
ncbi:kinase-like domain-containing protein [Ilyonectria robusta]|uniref:kinase-like domain-containing protein n=1 Tax=Ilyonectria robusta TaxID=1079257 RepID=UPI001E8CC90F|nr:kinase-like domain-containing protein [Ilyonectria robusta]KAH8651739.1 kinase-like domain-containing protein [Ilyonectria robusta]